MDLQTLAPMEEIYRAEAVYLWQYLTRTHSAGYFLALSGGLDSCTVALFAFGMAKLALEYVQAGEKQVTDDLRRIVGDKTFTPKTPQDIVSKLFHTCYMGTQHSSNETRSRSKRLSEALGTYHSDINIDTAVSAHEGFLHQAMSCAPRFSVEGGSAAENLAKQNIQARNRMVAAYAFAQMSTTARKLPRAGASLLVLSSANCDEALR